MSDETTTMLVGAASVWSAIALGSALGAYAWQATLLAWTRRRIPYYAARDAWYRLRVALKRRAANRMPVPDGWERRPDNRSCVAGWETGVNNEAVWLHLSGTFERFYAHGAHPYGRTTTKHTTLVEACRGAPPT